MEYLIEHFDEFMQDIVNDFADDSFCFMHTKLWHSMFIRMNDFTIRKEQEQWLARHIWSLLSSQVKEMEVIRPVVLTPKHV
jgi:hypothetical protein